ncbi:MAG: PAS domain S-box protein [Gemmatimonadaceae bacterium]
MLSNRNRPALRAALWYAALGAAWIYFSDRLLSATVRDLAVVSRVQMYKGWLFVLLSALLVFVLVRNYLRVSERALRALRESENRYRSIYETSIDGILYTMPDGAIVSANPAACRILGRTEAEICLLGRAGLIATGNPGLTEGLETLQQTGQWSGRLAFLRGDGSRFEAEVSTATFSDHLGQARASVIFRDDSARLAAAEALREAEEAERALIECSPVALYSLDFEGKVLSWNPAAQRIFGWSADEVLGQHIPIIPEDQRREYGQLLSRMRGGEFFTGREMVRQRRGGELFDASLSTAPIKDAQGRTVAVMAAVEDITERKKAERTLRANEERYRGIFENHGAAMLMIRPSDGRIVHANPAAAQFYGWSREWLCSMNIGDINSLPREQLAAEMALARTQRRSTFRFLHLLADGTQRWVEVFSSPVKVDGETLLYSIIHDVTRLHETEVALARSNRLHALLSEANHVIMRATEPDRLVQDICDLAVSVGGFRYVFVGRAQPDGTQRLIASAGDDHGAMQAVAELSAKGAHDAFRPSLQALSQGSRVVINNHGQLGSVALRAIADRFGIGSAASFPLHAGGKLTGTLTFLASEQDFFTDAELNTLEIVASDLSFGLELLAQRAERRALSAELQQAERRWRFALEGAGQAVMEWDIVTNATYFSPAWYQLIGEEVGEARSTVDEWLLRVHPDEVAAVRKSLDNHLGGHEPAYALEHRVRHRDGTYRWVLCRASVTSRSADGTPLMLIATLTDVTRRHVADERLALKVRRAQVLLALPAEAETSPEGEFLRRAARHAEEFTGSTVSFVHFVNPDEETVDLVAWSRRTLDERAGVAFDPHDPAGQAGASADAVRIPQPVVVNDMADISDTREGHGEQAELRRLVSVPVFSHGRVTMLVGVGNKAGPYDDDDVETVQLFANAIWRIVQHERDVNALRADAMRPPRDGE